MSLKRPPVEPLSRPAWDRIESGLFARLDRGEHLLPSVDQEPPPSWRSRGWIMAGALAAAAAVSLFWSFAYNAADDLAPVAPVAPVATAPIVAPAAPAAPLPRHEARIVSTDAPTQTTLGEAVITLAAHSDVGVAGSDSDGWLVRLDAGEVDCKVAPRNGRPPFVVQAGDTKVSVVGTRFTVTRLDPAKGGASARVSVTEGHVKVDSGDTHLLLGPGESWPDAHLDPTSPDDLAPSDPEPKRSTLAPGKKSAYVVTPRAQQRFERAARLEAKDPAAALAIYQQLARGKGPWAANALYAQARLELERGRPKRAEPLLRKYLERHPQGMNAADVRKLLEQLE